MTDRFKIGYDERKEGDDFTSCGITDDEVRGGWGNRIVVYGSPALRDWVLERINMSFRKAP